MQVSKMQSSCKKMMMMSIFMAWLWVMMLTPTLTVAAQSSNSTDDSSGNNTTPIISTICDPNPCMNNGTCTINDDQNSFTCTCELGYYGTICTNDFCTQNNPCQNNGTCVPNSLVTFACICTSAFGGDNCTTPLDVSTSKLYQDLLSAYNQLKTYAVDMGYPLVAVLVIVLIIVLIVVYKRYQTAQAAVQSSNQMSTGMDIANNSGVSTLSSAELAVLAGSVQQDAALAETSPTAALQNIEGLITSSPIAASVPAPKHVRRSTTSRRQNPATNIRGSSRSASNSAVININSPPNNNNNNATTTSPPPANSPSGSSAVRSSRNNTQKRSSSISPQQVTVQLPLPLQQPQSP
jgi:EGF-like domain